MIVTKTQFYNLIEVRQLGIKFTIKLVDGFLFLEYSI